MASTSRNRHWRWCRRISTGSAISFGTSLSLRTPPSMGAANSSGEARQPVENALDRGFVGRSDDPAARETRLNKDRLFLGELPESELAVIVPLSGCAHAAERQA